MESETHGFSAIILNMLNRWSALKLMVEHDMGGRQSLEKALYLVEFIQHIFNNNQSVEAEDLEDLLTEYIDTEFNTNVEDDSIIEISRALVRLFSVFANSGMSAAEEELRTLPPVTSWLQVGVPVQRRIEVDSESSDSEIETANMEEADDEWTKVSYGKKR